MKILVVEDNPVVGMDLVLTLEEWGHTASGPHATIEDALAAVEEFQPDAAFLDIDLKNDQSSEAVAHLLRKRKTPFLCLTGFSSRSQAQRPVFTGAKTLEKPFQTHTLKKAIEDLIASRSA